MKEKSPQESSFGNSAEAEITPEEMEKIMSKVVDIFSTKDLKYKDLFKFDVNEAMRTGMLNATSKFLLDKEGDIDMSVRHKIRELEKDREVVRRGGPTSQTKIEPKISNEEHAKEVESDPEKLTAHYYHQYRQSGNVFYPEGMLKVGKAKFFDKDAEVFDSDFRERNYHSSETSFANLLALVIKSGELPENMSFEDRSFLEEISKSYDVGNEKFNIDVAKRNKIEDILDSNPELWELMRLRWLKAFFQGALDSYNGNLHRSSNTEYSEKDWLEVYVRAGGFVEQYHMKFGLVLSPELKVLPSEEGDFPAQATVMTPRINPKKDVIGFFHANPRFYDIPKMLGKFKLPVYDLEGNLVWPKKMSHDEVAELVTAKKSQSDSTG